MSTTASSVTGAFTGSFALQDESKVLEDYVVGQRLGEGAYGSVYIAKYIPSGEHFALKILQKGELLLPGAALCSTGSGSPRSEPPPRVPACMAYALEKLIVQEATVMQALEHPHVVKYYKFLNSTVAFYFIMELAEGGELFDLIISRQHFSEDESRAYFQQLISATDYCHSKGVAHKDLKAENLLLSGDNRLLVCDFGFSSKSAPRDLDDPGDGLATSENDALIHHLHQAAMFGTLHYMSPEAVAASTQLGCMDAALDNWSVTTSAASPLRPHSPSLLTSAWPEQHHPAASAGKGLAHVAFDDDALLQEGVGGGGGGGAPTDLPTGEGKWVAVSSAKLDDDACAATEARQTRRIVPPVQPLPHSSASRGAGEEAELSSPTLISCVSGTRTTSVSASAVSVADEAVYNSPLAPCSSSLSAAASSALRKSAACPGARAALPARARSDRVSCTSASSHSHKGSKDAQGDYPSFSRASIASSSILTSDCSNNAKNNSTHNNSNDRHNGVRCSHASRRHNEAAVGRRRNHFSPNGTRLRSMFKSLLGGSHPASHAVSAQECSAIRGSVSPTRRDATLTDATEATLSRCHSSSRGLVEESQLARGSVQDCDGATRREGSSEGLSRGTASVVQTCELPLGVSKAEAGQANHVDTKSVRVVEPTQQQEQSMLPSNESDMGTSADSATHVRSKSLPSKRPAPPVTEDAQVISLSDTRVNLSPTCPHSPTMRAETTSSSSISSRGMTGVLHPNHTSASSPAAAAAATAATTVSAYSLSSSPPRSAAHSVARTAEANVNANANANMNTSNARDANFSPRATGSTSSKSKQIIVDPFMQDLWSAGVILFFMLTGRLPFDGRDDEETMYLIQHHVLHFTPEEEARISQPARELVVAMLAREPTERPSMEEIIHHPWFVQHIQVEADFPHRPNLAREIAEAKLAVCSPATNRSSRMPHDTHQAAPHSASASASTSDCFLDFSNAHSVTAEEESALRCAFDKIDTDGYGFITSEQVRDMLTTLHGDVVSKEDVRALMKLFTGDASSEAVTFQQFRDAWVNHDLAHTPFNHCDEFQLTNIMATKMDEVERQVVRQLRTAFNSVDVDNTGIIQVAQLHRVFERCHIDIAEDDLISLMRFFYDQDPHHHQCGAHRCLSDTAALAVHEPNHTLHCSRASSSVSDHGSTNSASQVSLAGNHYTNTTNTNTISNTNTNPSCSSSTGGTNSSACHHHSHQHHSYSHHGVGAGGGGSHATTSLRTTAALDSFLDAHEAAVPCSKLGISFDSFVMGIVLHDILLRHPIGRQLAAATNLTALFHSHNVTECVRRGFLVVGLQHVVLRKLNSVPARLQLMYSDEVVSSTEKIYSFRYCGAAARGPVTAASAVVPAATAAPGARMSRKGLIRVSSSSSGGRGSSSNNNNAERGHADITHSPGPSVLSSSATAGRCYAMEVAAKKESTLSSHKSLYTLDTSACDVPLTRHVFSDAATMCAAHGRGESSSPWLDAGGVSQSHAHMNTMSLNNTNASANMTHSTTNNTNNTNNDNSNNVHVRQSRNSIHTDVHTAAGSCVCKDKAGSPRMRVARTRHRVSPIMAQGDCLSIASPTGQVPAARRRFTSAAAELSEGKSAAALRRTQTSLHSPPHGSGSCYKNSSSQESMGGAANSPHESNETASASAAAAAAVGVGEEKGATWSPSPTNNESLIAPDRLASPLSPITPLSQTASPPHVRHTVSHRNTRLRKEEEKEDREEEVWKRAEEALTATTQLQTCTKSTTMPTEAHCVRPVTAGGGVKESPLSSRAVLRRSGDGSTSTSDEVSGNAAAAAALPLPAETNTTRAAVAAGQTVVSTNRCTVTPMRTGEVRPGWSQASSATVSPVPMRSRLTQSSPARRVVRQASMATEEEHADVMTTTTAMTTHSDASSAVASIIPTINNNDVSNTNTNTMGTNTLFTNAPVTTSTVLSKQCRLRESGARGQAIRHAAATAMSPGRASPAHNASFAGSAGAHKTPIVSSSRTSSNNNNNNNNNNCSNSGSYYNNSHEHIASSSSSSSTMHPVIMHHAPAATGSRPSAVRASLAGGGKLGKVFFPHRAMTYGGKGVGTVSLMTGMCDIDIILAPAPLGYTLVRFRRIHGQTSDFREAVSFISSLLEVEREQAIKDTMVSGKSELM